MNSNPTPELEEVIRLAIIRVSAESDTTAELLPDTDQGTFIISFLNEFDACTVNPQTINSLDQTFYQDNHLLYSSPKQRMLLIIEGQSVLWVIRNEYGEPTSLRLVGEWETIQTAMSYWLECSFLL